jgi:hypothetical protein
MASEGAGQLRQRDRAPGLGRLAATEERHGIGQSALGETSDDGPARLERPPNALDQRFLRGGGLSA